MANDSYNEWPLTTPTISTIVAKDGIWETKRYNGECVPWECIKHVRHSIVLIKYTREVNIQEIQ
jgi:hypothetical protein